MAKKGEHIPEETKIKMRKSAKRVWSDLELRKRQSESQKGEKNSMFGKKNKWGHHTPESNKKNSESHKGKGTWNKGIPCREETKRKLSEANKGKIPWMKGKHHSKKTKEKLKKARAKRITPVKDTSIEVKIQNFLKQLNIEFFTHQYMKIEHGYQCDILIPVQKGIDKKTIIECFGNYWHKYPIGREIDIQRCGELREKGWRVLTFWESEIKPMQLNNLQEKLIC